MRRLIFDNYQSCPVPSNEEMPYFAVHLSELPSFAVGDEGRHGEPFLSGYKSDLCGNILLREETSMTRRTVEND